MSVPHSQSAKELEKSFFAKLTSIIQSQNLHCQQTGIAVAYSGGLDSTVLLALASLYAQQEQIPIFAYHVNHGISANALAWETHCQNVCERLSIPFKAQQVSIHNQGQGIESVARAERYRALGQMCEADHVGLLLVAHHLEDQAETMLMQLFRGTGLRGLGGMDEFNFAPTLLNSQKVLIARPLLTETKSCIQNYATQNQLQNIEDESNDNVLFTRNATRHLLMPNIERIFPHFSERLLRTSMHTRSAQRLLDDLAKTDLASCSQNNVLDLAQLSQLNADRVSNAFRFWLSSNYVQLPSTSKIAEIQAQLFNARDDAKVAIRHGEFSICRYASRIYLVDHRFESSYHEDIEYRWHGEERKYFPELKGTLLFQPSDFGVNARGLSDITMVIRRREGGERLRLAKNRPSRDLKSHFQSAKIPFWQREKLPVIYVENRLFFVGLLGVDAAFLSDEVDESKSPEDKIQLIWLPDGSERKA
ncbi:tRNA lysidine(34) synthetase TilS [Undibacterium flavidum]|uniref:tRNA(Ile)-lysidine synthase n=1 Tax=Undibacterium flavidum TaxID=2762297 RepID=A0ABR6YEJ3_9BURK|nr:tRNA lysidine(34) synthetase TilS [Undibacterium flavidum]MBC3874972.1 tRNA lysidine(34) synthetase TilS [Undibacterium flavidum]